MVSPGACSEIDLPAVPVASGWPPGDQKGKAILHGFIRFRLQIGASLLRNMWNRFLLQTIYVTVDLDCLGESDAITNWENGRFALCDLVWAITLLRQKVRIVGGDLCGAFSPMRYGSRFQSLAGRFDHPRQRSVTEKERRLVNLRALETIWPLLVGEGTGGACRRRGVWACRCCRVGSGRRPGAVAAPRLPSPQPRRLGTLVAVRPNADTPATRRHADTIPAYTDTSLDPLTRLERIWGITTEDLHLSICRRAHN